MLPALCGFEAEGMEFSKVSGVRTDALLSLYIDGQKCEQERGELQLADYGISGIPVFQISGRVSRLLYQGKEPYLKLDVMPDDGKEKKPSQRRQVFTRLFYFGGFDFQSRRFFLSI